MSINSFSFPTPIRFGAGARKQVAAHLLEQGLKRPLIVTDRALGALPVMAEFRSHLDGLDVAVFAGVSGNPTCSQVMDGAAAYTAHNADCIIGFGGGAALDVAKLVGVAATHEGDILEYVWDHPQVRAITNPLPYFIALPTTSGTGSEVGRSAVVSENDTHLKRVVFSPKILARMVFADPELTLGLPACGHGGHRHGCAHAQHRELPLAGLPPAVRRHCAGGHAHCGCGTAHGRGRARQPAGAQRHDDGVDDGRHRLPEGPGRGAFCAHALGAVCDLHHGLANALMIDTVMAWNYEAVPAKFDELAHVCKVAGAVARPLCPGSRRSRPASASPGTLACARRQTGAHSRAWWRSPSPTSATRPIRGPARR
jgi:hypothetical protein